MFKMKCAFVFCLLLIEYVQGDIVSSFGEHVAMSASSECSNSLTLYLENLKLNPPNDSWAIKMLDASSKLPSGLLSLSFGEMGDFEECLATKSLDHSIQARYCLASISASSLKKLSLERNSDFASMIHQMNLKTTVHRLLTSGFKGEHNNSKASAMISGPSWAVCLPKNCSEEDVNSIFSSLPLHFSCQTKEESDPPLTTGAISTIVVFAFIICLMITSTIYDRYCISRRVPPHPLLVTFSLYTNGSKLFKMTRSSRSEFSCISGIRVISMIWVIFGHTFMGAVSGPSKNLLAFAEWCKQLYSMMVVSGTLAVDTFFCIGGVVLAYNFMKMKQNGMKFNICQFYVHRYIRLTPPLAAIVLVTATLSSYFGSGPHWSAVKIVLEDACKKDWWTALLYTQNYYHISDNSMCIGQSWYLDVDMQLFLLSPLVLLPLFHYPLIGQCLLYGYIGAVIITDFSIAYINDLSALTTAQIVAPNMGGRDNTTIFYMKTHTRATPWLLGILVGYYLSLLASKKKTVPQLRRELVLVVWAACLVGLLACIFGGHSTLMGPEYDRWGNSLHLALVRPAWTLCIAWVIVACHLDYGGPINKFLSLPIFQVLSRFTFSIYLIHLNLIYYRSFSHKTGTHFSFYDTTCEFWYYLMTSFGLSVFWALAFESPFIALERILLR